MRTVSGSAVYYEDARYLEVTVIFEDEESYLIDDIKSALISPLNANGYGLLPEPIYLDSQHGNLSNLGGEEAVGLRASVSNIPAPATIQIVLRDTDGTTYTITVTPQFRDQRNAQIGSEVNPDEIMDP